MKKSSLFYLTLSLLVAFSVAILFVRIVLWRDYPMTLQVSCDPATEACFTHTCDPAGEKCLGNVEQDTSYYKIIEKNAGSMPRCTPGSESCPEPTCAMGEAACTVVLCSEETVLDQNGDVCNNPSLYNQTHHSAEREGVIQ